ncbi:hypothetical protein LVD15_15300 [Fulvivirga maritima]|uniref:hypothetical protein n=1 Tax=Fulvivirga maritima TaxID=2904247 RepID=UPI001F21146F|nr:hypothetical protein [Fulvivirga maritima]UII24680.1 hypothetical protein LVD15_15300 [Fulvivirga maritima]
MSNNTKLNPLLFRDGTSQSDRHSEQLKPEYVEVEDRNLEDYILEAQRLAKELSFFNDQNQPVNNWEALLVGDAAAYHNETETMQQLMRNQWAAKLAAYVEDPASFSAEAEEYARLSRPHVVLFLTFLKLLNHIKSQINGLTQKHLDFYFQERLRLTPKQAVPDVVNVLLELADDVGQFEVKAGTILQAGTDDEGNELYYKTDRDTVITEAKIEQIKTVFVENEIITIADAHQKNLDNPDGGLLKMMQLALGSPKPGDALPPFPDGVADLMGLYTGLKDNAEKQAYVNRELHLTVEEFDRIISTYLEDKEGETEQWQAVYNILDNAFKNKVKLQRQKSLQAVHENSSDQGVTALLKHVYGTPNPVIDCHYTSVQSRLSLSFMLT